VCTVQFRRWKGKLLLNVDVVDDDDNDDDVDKKADEDAITCLHR